jgi:hypothetical protein
MATEEEVKKAQEEADKKFQDRLNERVARESEAIRKTAEMRFQAELDAVRAENKVLHNAINKRNEELAEACVKETAEMRERVDPALQKMFDDLPASISPEDKRDWLKKQLGEMPAPPPTKFPHTPRPDEKKKAKWEPHEFPNPF